MRIIFLTLCCLLLSNAVSAGDNLEIIYDQAIAVLDSDPDSAILYAENLKANAEIEDSPYYIVQADYILGWVYSRKIGNFGKSIIHYLECERTAKKKPFDGHVKELIPIKRNIARLYEQFGNYQEAEKYFIETLSESTEIKDQKNIIKSLISIADLRKKTERYSEALIANDRAREVNELYNSKTFRLDILNRKGNILKAMGEYESAIEVFKRKNFLANEYGESYKYSFAVGYNNIGESYRKLKNYDSAAFYFAQAIELKNSLENLAKEDPKSFFYSYKGLSDSYLAANKIDLAENWYLATLKLVHSIKSKSDNEYFDLYLKMAQLYEQKKDFAESNKYRRIYGEELAKYIEYQAEIERIDKKYNLELITQRYFSLVAQQEKNDQIQKYGSMTIGMFILIIIGLVAFNSYQKYVLRSEIEKTINVLEI